MDLLVVFLTMNNPQNVGALLKKMNRPRRCRSHRIKILFWRRLR